jgi:hypothetical protein
MSEIGLSHLLATMMAAGDVPALDARDHRLAHRAVVQIINSPTQAAGSILTRYGIHPHVSADPDVRKRVKGLTQAIWDATSEQLLLVREDGRTAEFYVNPSHRARLRRHLVRLPAAEAELIYRIGADWAASSTARKNIAVAATSPLPKRRASLA